MPITSPAPPELTAIPIAALPRQRDEVRNFLRSATIFLLIGLLLYGALYAASEWLIHRQSQRNRFHAVQTAPLARYDYVILGASHAAVFDYRDMNDRLESMTGASILNLATVGGGITVNRLLLDYFFREHDAGAVVYVLDSFAFYSREWNEDRLNDTELFARAPWDPALASLLLREPGARPVAVDYISGFSKINNPGRFEPDLFDGEGSAFDRIYRPIPQLDRQRIAYLYPPEAAVVDPADSPYLTAFEGLIQDVRSRGARFVVVRPPLPERIYQMLPNEARFEETIRAVLANHGAEFYDFTGVNNDPELFYDSDHLNQAGVLSFFENHLAAVLSPGGRTPR